jgi:hypothetical protein
LWWQSQRLPQFHLNVKPALRELRQAGDCHYFFGLASMRQQPERAGIKKNELAHGKRVRSPVDKRFSFIRLLNSSSSFLAALSFSGSSV